jgi:hypothetical protein
MKDGRNRPKRTKVNLCIAFKVALMNSKTEQNKTKQNKAIGKLPTKLLTVHNPIRHARMEIAGRQMPKDAIIVIAIESIDHAD